MGAGLGITFWPSCVTGFVGWSPIANYMKGRVGL